jgi:choline dehydrogenase
MPTEQSDQFDYVVVGSGGGGGPVAANLASAGFKVLLIEAGYEYKDLNYDVPAFHGQATQDPEMRWDFYVQHYSDPMRQSSRYDSKYVDGKGILYPRAGTLGGCTAHHALITIYPHNSDWEELAGIAKTYDPNDESWAPHRMRRIFERIERCGYLTQPDPKSRHGFKGWLSTDVLTDLLDLKQTLGDPDFQLIQSVLGAVHATIWDLDFNPSDPKTLGRLLDKIEQMLEDAPNLKELFNLKPLAEKKAELEAHIKGSLNKFLDPNQYQVTLDHREGVFLIPISVSHDERKRVGARYRIDQVQQRFPENLTIWSNTFVTKIVFDGKRAVGVEYVKSPKYYDAAPAGAEGRNRSAPVETVRVRREVIICGGTFNTPQLLMLSGIGPAQHLAEFGIKAVVSDLPAVGHFLQDRYEVGMISEYPHDFKTLGTALFRKPAPGEDDPALDEYLARHDGLYATNGAIVAVIRKSTSSRTDPDLFIFGLPATFKGYYPGYADALEIQKNRFTWAILKAHTVNKGGYVRLRSTSPFERPEINFKYFDEGTDAGGDDLESVVQGVLFVQRFTAHLGVDARPLVERGYAEPDMTDRHEIGEWIKREAWGHHASGTCRIGPKDKPDEAALDAHFKVRGVEGLRVVDASVFPSIPGFFIVTPVYMIAEKASESILNDAGWKRPGGAPDGLNLPDVI